MGWKNYDGELWKKVQQEAKSGITDTKVTIHASDEASGAINLAKQAARDANVISHIKFEKLPFEELLPKYKKGIIMINPPYGERLTEENINALYSTIGDHLKKNYNGYDAWIISSNIDAMKNVGLHAFKKNIRCSMVH